MKEINLKTQKQIFNDFIQDIKELKKNNTYTNPDNQEKYFKICNTIINSIKIAIKIKYEKIK